MLLIETAGSEIANVQDPSQGAGQTRPSKFWEVICHHQAFQSFFPFAFIY